MSKKYTYHKGHSYEVDGKSVTFATQLYKTGVYGILKNDPSLQHNFEPSSLVKLEKELKEQFKQGTIQNLEFGTSITVAKDENGLWKEV